MKIKIIAFFTVIMSFISGILGATFTYKFILPDEIKQESDVKIVSGIEGQIKNVYTKASHSVVNIIAKKKMTLYRSDPFGFFEYKVGKVKQEIGGGTGFFVTDTGLLVTNKHVVADETAEYTVVTSYGDELDATVLYKEPTNDLALVQVDFSKLKFSSKENYKKMDFAKATDTKIGQFAIAVGYTLAEFPNTVTFGLISGKNRQITVDGGVVLSGLLQTDAAINPGNSGGPLINLSGQVVGINTAIVDGSNGVGFAIPLTPLKIQKLINNIKK